MIRVGNTRRNPFDRGIQPSGFHPRSIFAASTIGAIYDYDDFSYLYQKSDGSTPVTALEQPVGLVVDQRWGGAVGSDVRSAGAVALLGTATAATFDTGTGAGSVTRVDASNQSSVRFTVTANTFYRITITNSGAAILNIRSGTEAATTWTTVAAGATVTAFVLASTAGVISITAASAATVAFTVSALVSLPGLHAYQSTDAARPVLSARYNLLLNTVFAGAVAGTPGTAPTSWAYGSSGGTLAVDTSATDAVLTFSATTARHFIGQAITAAANTSYTFTATVTANIGITFANILNVAQALAGATVSRTLNGAVATGNETPAAGDTLKVVLSVAATGGSATFRLGAGCDVNSTGSVSLSKPDLRLTADANSRIPAYQRVTTATNYDTQAGFKRFDLSDRTDDHFSVASGGGGTTGFLLCAAIQPTGAGTARTIFSDRGTNTGYKVEIDASNNLLFTAGNGTAFTTCTGPALTAGTPYVITCWHDGTNLNIRVNRGATTSQAFATATAGSTGFTIGKDNGAASGYYSGRRFAMTYIQNSTVPASALESLILWTASKGAISV